MGSVAVSAAVFGCRHVLFAANRMLPASKMKPQENSNVIYAAPNGRRSNSKGSCKMKVIGLIGKSNSGKTSALKYLMIKILEQKGVEVLYSSWRRSAIAPEELGNSIMHNWDTPKGSIRNLTIAVKYKDKIVGVTSFGDSLKYEIIPALEKIIDKCGGCDIFVCGRHNRNNLDEEFKDYSPIITNRVIQKYTNNSGEYDAYNKQSASDLFSVINENL